MKSIDMAQTFTPDDVARIAKLAAIPVTDDEKRRLADGFTATMAVVAKLGDADTGSVGPTHQVTGLSNVLRDDEVDETRMFSQEEALANAKQQHDGYFVVPYVLDKWDDA